MELSWSTFILEIINFLVLVWILKHFLYKPVQEIIAKRRAGIEAALNEARETKIAAETLEQQYRNRLSDWDEERQQAREKLSVELDQERTARLDELKQQLEQEQEKQRVAETQRLQARQQQLEKTALALAARFATRLLEESANTETENRLIDLVIKDMSQLPDKQVAALRQGLSKQATTIMVSSAYPVDSERREQLQKSVTGLSGLSSAIEFKENPELLAGIEITIGAWVLGANLRDELKGFIEISHGHEQS